LYTINTDLIKNSEDKEFVNQLKQNIANFDLNFTSDCNDPRSILRNREKRYSDFRKLKQINYRLTHASAISVPANSADYEKLGQKPEGSNTLDSKKDGIKQAGLEQNSALSSNVNKDIVLEPARQLFLNKLTLSEQANHPITKTGDQGDLVLPNKLNLQEAPKRNSVTIDPHHNFFSAPAEKDSKVPVIERQQRESSTKTSEKNIGKS
jgi:hypothetical protein